MALPRGEVDSIMKVFFLVAMILTASLAGHAAEMPEVLKKIPDLKESLPRYSLDFQRIVATRREGDPQDPALKTIGEFKKLGQRISTVVDDKKFMQEIELHDSRKVKVCYDGETGTSFTKGALYTIHKKRKPALSPTPMTFFNEVSFLFQTVFESTDKGATFDETVTGNIHMVEIGWAGRSSLVITIDGSKGYSITKVTRYDEQGAVSCIYEATDYREVSPGIWVPWKTIRTGYTKGATAPSEITEMAITNFELPTESVDESVFKMHIPLGEDGIVVRDGDTGTILPSLGNLAEEVVWEEPPDLPEGSQQGHELVRTPVATVVPQPSPPEAPKPDSTFRKPSVISIAVIVFLILVVSTIIRRRKAA